MGGGMIRDYQDNDLAGVLAMARKFYTLSGYESVIPFDDSSAERMILASAAQGMCFVAESDGNLIGFVLGMAFPSMVNSQYLIGAEMAWWVDPEHRGVGVGLLSAIENAARQNGVKIWSMVALESSNPDFAESIYLRRGYEKTERTYSRYH
jgi:L-amino acid N-acyltransferase YncA